MHCVALSCLLNDIDYTGYIYPQGSIRLVTSQLFAALIRYIYSCIMMPVITSDAICIKLFHWLVGLFLPIRFDVTIVSIGNNCNIRPDRPESP